MSRFAAELNVTPFIDVRLVSPMRYLEWPDE